MFGTHAQPHKVLVVDDEFVPRSLECFALEGTGRYAASQAGNALDALGMLSSDGYEVAIIDYDMPDMSGTELIDVIRAKRENDGMPIVLVLPEEARVDESAISRAGATRVITKPFEPWNLARILDTLLPPLEDADHILSVESVLQGLPYPAMILDAAHHVLLANGAFYEATDTGIGSCYVFCTQQMHDDGEVPQECPLVESVRTHEPAEKQIDTAFGAMRITVYPLATRSGDGEHLYLHVTMPVDC